MVIAKWGVLLSGVSKLQSGVTITKNTRISSWHLDKWKRMFVY